MMRVFSMLLSMLLALFSANAVFAQSPASAPPSVFTQLTGLDVVASFDRESIEVGEVLRVQLAFSGEGASSARIALQGDAPAATSVMLGEWDLLGTKPIYDAKGVRTGLQLTLSTLDATAALETIPLSWDSSGDSSSAQTGEAKLPSITVQSLVGEEADPASYRDIAGAMEIRDAGFPWVLLILAVAVAIVAAFLAAYFLRRKKSLRVELPHERALRELATLDRMGIAAPGGCHAFYVSLTDTVRGYVTDRFRIGATRWTTREFAMHARESGDFSDAQVDRITALLQLADFVKFAGAQTDSVHARADVASARAFVTDTIPVAAPLQEKGTTR